jgi:ribonuclease HII
VLGQVEQRLLAQGFRSLSGIDEAGRGSLCGPVVAACVVFPAPTAFPEGLADSKQLSEAQRERLYPVILDRASAVGRGVVDAQVIDEVNILQATFRAMRQALAQVLDLLEAPPELVLVDGNQSIPDVALPQQCLVKGDARSAHIAAASIVAKVERDRIMLGLHQEYPGYGFDRHKGYGTRQHMNAITTLGPCPIHRRTFLHG